MSYEALEARFLEALARHTGGWGQWEETGAGEEAFDGLALEIYRFQRAHNAPYRQFCDAANAPREPGNWREIPAVPTTAFRHAALCAFDKADAAAVFHTSGTTGEGFGRHFFRSLRLYDASILTAWKALGIPPLPQILLVRRPQQTPHSSLSHMMGALGAFGPQSWCLDAEGRLDTAAFCRACADALELNAPVLLLGTALAFLHLFEQLGESVISLPPGSRCMETGGYKGSGRELSKAALYQQFRERLTLPAEAIFNEYSMTELSSQWYTRGLGKPHHGPPWTRALVIDPETGREVPEGGRGLVRLFDLANLGSVLAIQTHDLAIRRGSGFELLGRDPAALPRGCSRAADERLRPGVAPG